MKKQIILSAVLLSLLFSTFIMSSEAQAGQLFNYSQLALKDLDQMSKLIQTKIAESRKSGGDKIIPLKEVLQAVYSRPNEDLMIEKIISPLKNELEEHEAWDKSLQGLVKEAIGAIKNPKAFQPTVQVTYLVFLENILSEMRPRMEQSFESKIVKQIADAKLQVSKEADNERRLRVMKGSRSPSDIAEVMLKDAEESKKQKANSKAPVEEVD